MVWTVLYRFLCSAYASWNSRSEMAMMIIPIVMAGMKYLLSTSYSNAVTMSSLNEMKVIMPATRPKRIAYDSQPMSPSFCDRIIHPMAPASVSASPETVPQKKARQRDPVAWNIGAATQIPSGMLCTPIAIAIGAPFAGLCAAATNVASPSGKLCSVMASPVTSAMRRSRRSFPLSSICATATAVCDVMADTYEVVLSGAMCGARWPSKSARLSSGMFTAAASTAPSSPATWLSWPSSLKHSSEGGDVADTTICGSYPSRLAGDTDSDGGPSSVWIRCTK
mmetsp:Transcript_8424/g.21510  ORF Transcript_8424/g.21510 Transcript_8424/m.21510 type:complete len:280 (+) Transcript_8424:290-1129(+)